MKKQIMLKDVFPGRRSSKYRNHKIKLDGQTFDSIREMSRYQELKLLERTGQIRNLQRQVPFELIPSQKDKNGKVIEKKCSYIADFVYMENGSDAFTVEDAKGMKTEVYKIKKKLMLQRYGIRIKEV